jgi:alkylation response protein AidB-like acyl-CoA dehydrogenase
MRAAHRDVAKLASVNKVWYPQAHQRLTELGMRVSNALRNDPSAWYESWLNARPESIYGGAVEIQRNLLAERFLGLPRSPRPNT